MNLNCHRCGIPTKADPDPSYWGEMRVCEACGFRAYDDQWDAQGKFIPETNQPF